MLAFIDGIVKSKRDDSIVLLCGALGFRVFLKDELRTSVRTGQKLQLHVYHHISETQQSLFGFVDAKELNVFELLLTVSGIGPKNALSVLNKATPAVLYQAVVKQNADFLHETTGIGKRIADRIVVGLKNKVSRMEGVEPDSAGGGNVDMEVLQALLALGYSQREAQEALQSLPTELLSAEDRVAKALQMLAHRSKVSR